MAAADMREVEQGIRTASAFLVPLRREVGRVLVGQHALVDSLLTGLLANGHVLVEGVPGLAKTLAVKLVAQAVGGTFSRVQFTPDLLPADLVGTTVYDPRDHTFSVRQGPVFANFVLADEINRSPAKVQSALLEAMQERQVTIGGRAYPLPDPFLVMATQNPIEHEGTYALPEAQVDRFMLKVAVGYPTRDEERQIVARMAHPAADLQVSPVTSPAEILQARAWVDRVYVDPKVTEYILDIVFASRPTCRGQLSERQRDATFDGLADRIEYGASPRAGLALTLAAKARAFLAARAYVLPEDVKAAAPEVLRHRLIPTFEAEAENLSTDDLVQRLLDALRTP